MLRNCDNQAKPSRQACLSARRRRLLRSRKSLICIGAQHPKTLVFGEHRSKCRFQVRDIGINMEFLLKICSLQQLSCFCIFLPRSHSLKPPLCKGRGTTVGGGRSLRASKATSLSKMVAQSPAGSLSLASLDSSLPEGALCSADKSFLQNFICTK